MKNHAKNDEKNPVHPLQKTVYLSTFFTPTLSSSHFLKIGEHFKLKRDQKTPWFLIRRLIFHPKPLLCRFCQTHFSTFFKNLVSWVPWSHKRPSETYRKAIWLRGFFGTGFFLLPKWRRVGGGGGGGRPNLFCQNIPQNPLKHVGKLCANDDFFVGNV